MINYDAMNDPHTYVPFHMREGFKLWIEHAISPGSFGMAVLSNDLTNAINFADSINKWHLNGIVSWLFYYAPSECWGSPDCVKNWKGLEVERPEKVEAQN